MSPRERIDAITARMDRRRRTRKARGWSRPKWLPPLEERPQPVPDVRGVVVTFVSKETGTRVSREFAEADARLRRALPELAERDRQQRDAGVDAIEQALRQMRAARGFPPFT